ncbi:MAG: MBL fold metallo-hydrolase [Deltaproteobacteria bacterium]|jgi:hydroxyacylglutathione hydrolase
MEEKHFGPITFIAGENQGKYPFCHSIYIEEAGVLIDPASNRERLVDLAKNSSVKEIWLSHWHEDHIMHLDLFDDHPFRISEADAPPLSDLDLFMDSYGEMSQDERAYWKAVLVEQFHFRPRKPAHFLRNGEVIRLDSVTVEVIGTPGHTPGHTAFLFREPEVLALADYDLTKFGPWYGDVHASIEETIKSVNHLRAIPAKVWLTCHETGVFEEDPSHLWDEYLDVIRKRERKLLELLEEPRSFAQIVGARIIYRKPREPKAFYEFGERLLMRKHLEKLISEGAVMKKGEKYVKHHVCP